MPDLEITIPPDPVESAVETVTEPAADVVDNSVDATTRKLDELIAASRIHTDRLTQSSESVERVLGHLGNLANQLTEVSGNIATAAAAVAGESAQTVLAVPSAAAEVADAGIEAVADPGPKQSTRKNRLKRRR